MGVALVNPKQFFKSASGGVLANGTVQVYVANSTTPTNTWQDEGLSSLNTNPIQLDSGGSCVIWVDPTILYKFVVYNSGGVEQYTVDNIKPAEPAGLRALLAASSGSSLVGFIQAGTGAVERTAQAKMRERVSVKDFGAVGDGAADDTAAIQAAIDYTQPLGRTLFFPVGTYRITSSLVGVANSQYGMTWIADGGPKVTRISYPALAAATAALIVKGGSGHLSNANIEGFGWSGNASSYAIEMRGACGQRVRRCEFGTNAIGILLHNYGAGEFTEYCVADACDFTSSCATVMRYKRTAGNESFHGSGLVNGCTINTPTGAGYQSIIIDNGTVPYNAPLQCQVWANATGTFIYTTKTGAPLPYFVGQITVEPISGTLTLADTPAANEIAFVGTVSCFGDNLAFGDLFVCQGVADLASGSRQVFGGRCSKQVDLTTGTNAMPSMPYAIDTACMLYMVRLSDPLGYEYRQIVAAWNGFATGVASVLATLDSFNVTGYGNPTYGVNASHQLTITNASFPASGVTAHIDAIQLSQSQFVTFIK